MRNLFKLSPHAIPALLPVLMLLFFCLTSFAGEGINVGTDSSTQAAAEPPEHSELDAAAAAEPASSTQAEADIPNKTDSKNPKKTLSVSAMSASTGASASNSTESAVLLLSGANAMVQTGAATYSIPIGAPPGRADLAPNLALRYNSYQQNGWLGVGWDLDMGAIQRSTKFGVNYGANDFALSVNGATTELVVSWGNHYVAKIEDSFAKIYRDPATGGFVQTTKDGKKYYFGSTDDSRQHDPNNGSLVFKWCLDKVEDTNGNYMTITYVKDRGQMYLSQIAYTGNSGLSPTNSVNFILENRTDAPAMYTSNFGVTTAKRLKAITTYGNNQLAGKYVLNYDYSASTFRSLVSSVTLYGSDGTTALPGITLRYQEGGNGSLPDRLSSVTTPLGATAAFTYTPSSAWPRSQTSPNHHVPFILQTVSAIRVSDGLGNTSTTNYSYAGGWFDVASRELRGFETAVSTKPDGTIVTTQFHQDDLLKGRQQWVESKNSAGQLLGRDTFTWDTAETGDSTFVKLSRKVSALYENGALAVTTQENMTYDDTNGNLLAKTISGPGAEAVTTAYLYQNYGDWLWRPTRETLSGGVSGKVRETSMAYQTGTGNVLSKQFWLNGGTNPQVTYEAYDGYGNPTRVRDAKGNLTVTEYDPATHTYPVKISNPLGHFVEFAHDQRYGKLLWEKNVNGKLTSYAYDTFGRPVQVDFPDGGRTSTQYVEAALNSQTGAITTPRTIITRVKEDMAGHTIDKRQYVDGLGRTIQTITTGVTAPVVVRSSYDNMGRNHLNQGPFFSSGALQYPMGAPTEYPWQRRSFDDHGRPWKAERPDGGYGTLATTVAYNGLTTTITDADNKKKKETRDYLGRLMTVVEDPGGLNHTTAYEYNAAGNLRQVRDAAANVTTINYDTLGRKINMTDPDMGSWAYTYDANGNLLTQTDAKGQKISFGYDAINRITTKTYSNGDPRVTYLYDNPQVANGKGKLASVITSKATTSYSYDTMGRPLSTIRTITGDQARTTAFTFDPSGKPLTTTYPDGYKVTNSYYPGTGLLWKVTGSDGTVFATYAGHSASGQIGVVDHANGTGTAYTYDAWSERLQAMVTEDATGLPANDIQRKTYSHTRAGDIERITDQKRGIAYSYTYDALHRLTAETNTGGSPANNYAYNAIGNITRSMGKDTRTYAYGPGGRPHAVKEIRVNGIPHTFTYDNNGNMTLGRDLENPVQVATRTVTYNADNMPTRITHSAKGTTDLVYDGTGGRVKKISDTSTTYYIGPHFEIINNVATKYIFAGNTRVAMVKAGQTLYFHQDHLGSSSAMSNAAGKVVETTEHQPYGAVRSRTGVEASNYNFTGQEADPSSGLYNYNARLYDPATGMFISADTIVPNFSDPQSLNRYMYARGNPLVYTDPSGHFFGIDDIIIGAVIGAVISGLQSDWDPGAMVTGAVIGGISGGTYSGVNGWALSAGMDSVTAGAAGGAAAGATAGGLGAAYYGGDVGSGMLSGAGYGAIGGAVFGGIEGHYGETWNMPRVGVSALAGGGVSELCGQGFEKGAIYAGAMAFAAFTYNKFVQYGADWKPGGEAQAKDRFTMPYKGTNNIGVQGGPVDFDGLFNEGGIVSRGANHIPGVNATAGMHDVFQVKLDEFFGGQALGAFMRSAVNVPAMGPAAALSYGALMADPRAMVFFSIWQVEN